jgi:molybdate transport system substrate-binding protein
MASLHVLSGGAAQALVTHLQNRFLASHAMEIDGMFGAVGMMRDGLLAGTPCDVLILTRALITELSATGQLLPASARDLGSVRTGIAVPAGAAHVPVATRDELKAALLSASALYLPDPVKSTAGIHVMKMLRALDIETGLGAKLRPFPNGAAAMQAMSENGEPGLIGCTQITEILYADGVDLVGPLPKEFELATVYTAAVTRQSAHPLAAAALVDLLASDEAAELRKTCGFDA